jgi:hypothetical protein
VTEEGLHGLAFFSYERIFFFIIFICSYPKHSRGWLSKIEFGRRIGSKRGDGQIV